MFTPGVLARHPATRPAPSRIADLFFLGRQPVVIRLASLVIVLAIATAVAAGLVSLQQTFHADANAGRALNSVTTLIAGGASPATAWPGWVATLAFGIAVVVLMRGNPDPPMGRRPASERTVAELRAGLRREYRAARIALVVVSIVAAVDVARTVLTLALSLRPGFSAAGHQLLSMPVEAVGYAAAATVLGIWSALFRTELERLGAL